MADNITSAGSKSLMYPEMREPSTFESIINQPTVLKAVQVGAGVGDAVRNTVEALSHPIDTVSAVARAARQNIQENTERLGTANGLAASLSDGVRTVVRSTPVGAIEALNGRDYRKAGEFILAGGILGVTKKAGKAGKLADAAGAETKAAKGAAGSMADNMPTIGELRPDLIGLASFRREDFAASYAKESQALRKQSANIEEWQKRIEELKGAKTAEAVAERDRLMDLLGTAYDQRSVFVNKAANAFEDLLWTQTVENGAQAVIRKLEGMVPPARKGAKPPAAPVDRAAVYDAMANTYADAIIEQYFDGGSRIPHNNRAFASGASSSNMRFGDGLIDAAIQRSPAGSPLRQLFPEGSIDRREFLNRLGARMYQFSESHLTASRPATELLERFKRQD